jgi:spore germination cell wall hydrolase CwlJ-like protein
MLERSIVIFFLAWFTLAIGFQAITGSIVTTEPKPQEEQIAKPVNPVNAKHLQCLATGIYYEAKGEALLGQIAVARVIMNRVQHGFGSNPCKVVYQTTVITNNEGDQVKRCQFSWVCDDRGIPSENNLSYRKALDIAHQVLAEDKWNDILPNNTLFFHNLTVAPGWVYKKVTTIGNHVFYSSGNEKNIPAQSKDK